MFGNAQARPRISAGEAFARGIPAELTTFVQRTYGLLAFSLVLGAAACYGMMRVMPTVEVLTRQGPVTVPDFPRWGLFALWGATLVFSIIGSVARSGARQGEVSVLGLVGLVGMVLASGAMLGPTIGTYVGLGMASTVAAAAIITAVAFSALTAVVFVTGKNFSFLGGLLLVGILALVAAQLLNMFFFKSGTFHLWYSVGGALLFCGFILFDTSAVVHNYGPQNMVVPAVIALYLDIFNLFVMLLSILSHSNRRES